MHANAAFLERVGPARARLLLTLVSVSLSTVANANDAPPMNVVLILADDLGWSDLGCYGADLHETPHLDQLAKQSVRFTHAYAACVCSPTRASILTGKHPARLGITVWRERALRDETDQRLLPPVTVANLPRSEVTLAEALRPAGYHCAHVGKWHLGDAEFYPETQGFDVNVGGTHWGAPATYFHPFNAKPGAREPRYVPGLGWGKPGDYLPDRLTDEAIRLMEQAGDRPFFLNLWHHHVHTPIEGKPELVEHYRKKLRPSMRHRHPGYAAMVHALDANVGRVLEAIDRLGIADRTVVVFTSDNGGYIMEQGGVPVTNNAPLRSGKGSLYEGGVRVPLLVRAPGGSAGASCDTPVALMDLYPTILELVGVKGDPQQNDAMDATSFARWLSEPSAKAPARDFFFHYPHYYPTTPPASAVRSGDWKLIEYLEDSRAELFHLSEDEGETRDWAAAEPGRVEELRKKLIDWRQAVGARMPTPNPNWKPEKK